MSELRHLRRGGDCVVCPACQNEDRLEAAAALEEMRLRAEAAEARIASVSGVTREELVRNERERCARIVENTASGGLTAAYAAVIAHQIRGGK